MQLALGRVPLENPVNHKLRVLVRVDVDPGHVTLEVTGCLTQSDFPALLHIMRRAGRLGAGTGVLVDLHGASHLDPEILLQLRSIADASAAAPSRAPGPDGTAAGKQPFRVTLAEPADLPICLLHVGSDGEVLAGLEGELAAVPLLDPAAAWPFDGDSRGVAIAGQLDPGLDEACGPIPTRSALSTAWSSPNTSRGPWTRPPLSGLCPTSALGQLADALYRHLDTSNPSFGAHTWYELAAEELQNRHLGAADGPAEGELAAGQALA